jgi:hypothetical protein
MLATVRLEAASPKPVSQLDLSVKRKDGYTLFESPRFIVHSTMKRGETKRILRYLEIFADTALEIYPAKGLSWKNPLIYLYESRREYFIHVRKFGATDAKYGAGYFSPAKGMIAAYWSGTRESTVTLLFHELAHLCTMRYFQPLPQALNEGLSTYFETADLSHHNLEFGIPNARYRELFVKMVKNRSLVPLSQFLSLSGYRLGSMHETFGAPQYAQAWALVFYCLHGPREVQKRFRRYLSRLKTEPDARGTRFLETVAPDRDAFISGWIRCLTDPDELEEAAKRPVYQL